MPPSQQFVSGQLRFDHMTLGIGYIGIAMLFLNPRFLMPGDKSKYGITVSAIIIISVIITFFLFRGLQPPAATLLTGVFGESLSKWVGLSIRAVMISVGIMWLLSTLKHILRNKHEPLSLWVHLSALALACVPVMVSHNFSSRYIVGGLTITLIQALPTLRLTPFLFIRVLLGAGLGYLSLRSYYYL